MKKILLLIFIFNSFFSFAQEQKEIDSLKTVLKTETKDTSKIEICKSLADEYIEQNLDSCIYYSSMGIDLSNKLKNKMGIASCLNKIGKSYTFFGNEEKSFQYLFESMKVGEEIENGEGKFIRMINYLDIARIYDWQNDREKAIEFRRKALGLMNEIVNDPLAKAKIRRNKNIQIDSSYWKIIEGGIYDWLAQNFTSLNENDSALFYFEKAENIWKESELENFQMMTLFNKSAIYINKNELDKALKNYYRVLEFTKRDSSFMPSSMPLSYIANIYNIQHKYDEAIKIFNELLLTAKKDKVYYEIESAYTGLAEAYKKKNDYKMAYLLRDTLLVLKDSLDKQENQKNIAEMKVKYETSEKEKQIKILEQENKLKDLAAEREKLIRKILIGGSAIILLLAFVTIMYFVKKRKGDKLIADEKINAFLKDQELKSMSDALEVQENERRRIASDLHDRLGSMLSTVKIYFSSVEEQIDKFKEQNKELYNKANSLLDDACEEVRKISHNLVSGELVNFGLVSALNQMVKTIEDAGQLKIKMFSLGMQNRLDSSVEIMLYRIIQELVNNILKHSKASEVIIQLNKTENNLNIVIEDNGVGFDTSAINDKGGMGLKNIKARVDKLNGKIFNDSGKGRGTTTIIDIPV